MGFSLAGCVVLVTVNVVLVPRYGYMACAWGGFAGYGVAMLLSYFVGQKKYPIRYDLKAIGGYVLLAAVLYAAGAYLPIDHLWLRLLWRTVLLLAFVAYIIRRDLPLCRCRIGRWSASSFVDQSIEASWLNLRYLIDNRFFRDARL